MVSRHTSPPAGVITLPAIRVRQAAGRVLYSFAIDGKLLPRVAAVARVRRNGDAHVLGYQRHEVLSHIGEIRTYIEGPAPMLPNAVVVAFDSRVEFRPADPRLDADTAYTEVGALHIPLDERWYDADKPGLIVDGQQRIAAIRDADVPAFPVCVTAFITDDLAEQTEQFMLVNATKPLPKGLLYELLPATEARLPSSLQRRRLPARVMERLNHDPDSPLRGMIQTPTTPGGIIKDNAILCMLENSLNDGVLYRYRRRDTEEGDIDGMLRVLYGFWSAVRRVFADAWALPPKRSRLMHGAGVVSMGFVMDAIAEQHGVRVTPSEDDFAAELALLGEVCCWTAGRWDFGPGLERRWDELQNTSKDTRTLTNYLLGQYKAHTRRRTKRQRARSPG